MELVAFLGNDKENWGQISALIKKGNWEKVILLKNKRTESFPIYDNCEIINIDCDKSLDELKNNISENLKERLKNEFESGKIKNYRNGIY
ncbi:MAG: hypothetical protein AAB867_03110, partial [Patescibacteria group bacterium]